LLPKRPKACGEFEKFGDTLFVDTAEHEMNSFKGLSEATIRVFGCDALVGVVHGHTAGAAERPHVRQGQERARPIQNKSFLGFQRDRGPKSGDLGEARPVAREMRLLGLANNGIDELVGYGKGLSFFW